MTPFEALIRSTVMLCEMWSVGEGESEKADTLRDEMDKYWFSSSESEQETARIVSAAISRRDNLIQHKKKEEDL